MPHSKEAVEGHPIFSRQMLHFCHGQYFCYVYIEKSIEYNIACPNKKGGFESHPFLPRKMPSFLTKTNATLFEDTDQWNNWFSNWQILSNPIGFLRNWMGGVNMGRTKGRSHQGTLFYHYKCHPFLPGHALFKRGSWRPTLSFQDKCHLFCHGMSQ